MTSRRNIVSLPPEVLLSTSHRRNSFGDTALKPETRMATLFIFGTRSRCVKKAVVKFHSVENRVKVLNSPYQYNPDKPPDSQFEQGALDHIVVGNEGRALDYRRTPVRIKEIRESSGLVIFEIQDFEDKG